MLLYYITIKSKMPDISYTKLDIMLNSEKPISPIVPYFNGCTLHFMYSTFIVGAEIKPYFLPDRIGSDDPAVRGDIIKPGIDMILKDLEGTEEALLCMRNLADDRKIKNDIQVKRHSGKVFRFYDVSKVYNGPYQDVLKIPEQDGKLFEHLLADAEEANRLLKKLAKHICRGCGNTTAYVEMGSLREVIEEAAAVYECLFTQPN